MQEGAFANVVEAKRVRREFLIEQSDYEFKHLLYRGN